MNGTHPPRGDSDTVAPEQPRTQLAAGITLSRFLLLSRPPAPAQQFFLRVGGCGGLGGRFQGKERMRQAELGGVVRGREVLLQLRHRPILGSPAYSGCAGLRKHRLLHRLRCSRRQGRGGLYRHPVGRSVLRKLRLVSLTQVRMRTHKAKVTELNRLRLCVQGARPLCSPPSAAHTRSASTVGIAERVQH